MSMHNEAGAGARTRSRRGTCGGMGSLASFWADLGPLYEITLVRRSSARASDASMGPAGPDTTHHRPVTPAAAVRGAAIGKLGVQGYGRGGGGLQQTAGLGCSQHEVAGRVFVVGDVLGRMVHLAPAPHARVNASGTRRGLSATQSARARGERDAPPVRLRRGVARRVTAGRRDAQGTRAHHEQHHRTNDAHPCYGLLRVAKRAASS